MRFFPILKRCWTHKLGIRRPTTMMSEPHLQFSTETNTTTSFVPVGKDVFLRAGKPSASNHPQLVLIFGWMGAQLPHLHKYTKAYEKLFPDATQVLVRCHRSFFFSTEKTKHATLSPVVEVLEALDCFSSALHPTSHVETPSRILVHAFSNGGASQLITVSDMLRHKPYSPSLPATNAIIFDSCPGFGGLSSSIDAFTSSISNPLLRYLAISFLILDHATRFLIYLIPFRKSRSENLKEKLNNPSLLPWMDTSTPRLYLYSKTDKVVPWDQVQAHAEDARRKGMCVKCEVFEGSEHVAHARADPARYWGAVENVWRDARKIAEER